MFGLKKKKTVDFPEEQTGVAEPLVNIQVMPTISEREQQGAFDQKSAGVASAGRVASSMISRGSQAVPSKKTGFLHNKKILISSGVILFLFFVGGATWYYIYTARPAPSGARAPAPVAPTSSAQIKPPAATSSAAESAEVSLPPSLAGTVATTTPEAPSQPVAPSRPSDLITFLDEREYTLGSDLDGDQLSDLEEGYYETDTQNPDTDADTFPDGWEIVNLYDPARGSGLRLIDAPAVEKFVNRDYGYELFVQSGLTLASADPLDMKELTLTAPNGELMRLSIEPNPDNLNIRAWLEQKYGPSSRRIVLNRLSTKAGASGWVTNDGLTKYFVGQRGIIMWRYEPGTSATVNFRQTWDMMSAAFVFSEPTAPLQNAPPAAATSTPESATSTVAVPLSEPIL